MTTEQRVDRLEWVFERQAESLLALTNGMASIHTILTEHTVAIAELKEITLRLERFVLDTHPHNNGAAPQEDDDGSQA